MLEDKISMFSCFRRGAEEEEEEFWGGGEEVEFWGGGEEEEEACFGSAFPCFCFSLSW